MLYTKGNDMTSKIRNLKYLVYINLFAALAVMIACVEAPAASVNNDASSSRNISTVETGQIETTDASWEMNADLDASTHAAMNMSSASPSEDGAPPASVEIDADAIVAAYEKVIGDVHEDVLPSVVSVFVLNRMEVSSSIPRFNSPFLFGQRDPQSGDSNREFYYTNGQGSGFVWDQEGHIVTNRHVVSDAERIVVLFSDGNEYEAEVVGSDEASDLAVLKVQRDYELLNPVSLGDSNDVRVGQLAITIGNPFGQEFTTTTGIISAIGRTIRAGDSLFSLPKVIQTDAPMNPGNSGGPLLDRRGDVIGIDVQIITRSGGNTGIGFAIPVNMAKQIVPVLIDEGVFTYSWLGIRGTNVSPEGVELMNAPIGTRGAQVISLARDAPAEKAGLVGSSKTERTDDGSIRYGGDVITAIDGQSITSMNDLIIYLIENTRPGDTVTMSVVRDGGESAQIKVTLEARPGSVS